MNSIIESKTKHQAITCHCSVMSAISLLLADCYLMHMFNLMTEGLNFVAITVINLLLSLPHPPDKFPIPTPLDICFVNVQKFRVMAVIVCSVTLLHILHKFRKHLFNC